MLSEAINAWATLPPLGELVLKLTALLATAWICKPLLSKINPRWQVFYWRGVAAMALLLPVVVLLGPTIPVALLAGDSDEPMLVTSEAAVSVGQVLQQRPAWPDPVGGTDAMIVTGENAAEFDSSLTTMASENVVDVSARSWSAQLSRWTLSTMLAVAWFLPATLLSAGALMAECRIARLVRRAEPVAETTTELLDQVAQAMGYTRTIRARRSSEVDSPFVTGLFRPAILLPESLEDHEQIDLRGIFAHEVNHIASHDLLWSRVIQFLSLGCWFHPLIWGLGRQHRDACERAADAVAAEHVGDAGTYAGTLARIALAVIEDRRALAGIAMARTPGIQERLRRLDAATAATPLRRRQVVPLAVGGLALLLMMGGLRLVEARSPVTDPPATDPPVQPLAANPQATESVTEQAAAKPVTQYQCRLVDVVTGAPVAGAKVTVQRRISSGGKPFEQWPMKRQTECTTDAEGRYSVDIRPDEAAERLLYVEIATKHADYVDWYGGYSYSMISKNLQMGSGPFFKSIGIWPAVKLRGTVLTPNGKPAAGVEVFGYSKFRFEKFKPRGFFMEGKTDNAGAFELNAVRGGKSVLWLSPKDYCPSTHLVEPRLSELGKLGLDYLHLDALAPADMKDATKTRDLGPFVLQEGIQIDGRVVDADGAPLEGVWVNASLKEGPAKQEIGMNLADHIDRSALTDADGRYRMGPLPASTYRVTPWEEPRERSVQDRTLRPVPGEFFPQKVRLQVGMKTATVNFQAVPHTTIVAQYYRSSGEPCRGHEVDLTGSHEDEFYWKRCRPDASGRLEFTAPIGLQKASLGLITNEHSALRHRLGNGGPLSNRNRVELGTLTAEMKEIAIIRYVAPIVLINVVDEHGKQIKHAWVTLAYAPGRAPMGDSQYLRNDRLAGDVSLEQHGDGRWRTSQLLPDEPFTLSVEADGYETNTEQLSLPEDETREIEVRLKKTAQK